MKGLELSEKYYREIGAPMIEDKFSEYSNRIAAGLVGEGSECFGYDDEISRDHDWGPSFCLWLTKEDFQQIGARLHEEINKLPKKFGDISPRQESQYGSGRIGVFEIIQITQEMEDLILKNPSSGEIWDLAKKQGARSLFDDGIEKVKNGITSLEELLRVAEPL